MPQMGNGVFPRCYSWLTFELFYCQQPPLFLPCSLLKNESTVSQFAQQLVGLAQYYGFDGWLVNIENPIHVSELWRANVGSGGGSVCV